MLHPQRTGAHEHSVDLLAQYLGKICKGESDESLLDLYVKKRRTANIEFVQTQSISNKQMLEEDRTPESESRMGNIQELINAAADAAERGEGLAEFLDHAALAGGKPRGTEGHLDRLPAG